MRVKIKEFAIADFQSIYQLDRTHKRLLGNLVKIWSGCTQIVSSFYQKSSLRPLIKKVGICIQIILVNLQIILDDICYQQMIYRYIKSIGWHDLQYIAFIACSCQRVEIILIFNRVISTTQIIDLKCLGASVIQYAILNQAYTDIVNTANPKFYV
ncbi:hypothetical protein A6770_32355 [Nostoc minutum NIES-26]|uniref:Uncharacterized protein n=1 Tax=Nostoc minutum NIES-26 TaxID=1844469 RepID=A0A367Q6Z5_9NOSO|nr:hypothetical protein A6770_32355 [Nostoc minutum NIES-26]